ncbi:hypothetical protein BU16DRAFT_566049 [Lophium mytilinum]|uniref:Uncharacterized protein n=1 Tax=Lophium mytilinum TaxID=390894 RepID=A0A6A6QGJ6_9PEZI|nr:hypothetical protein BU16DRAFT_566049 [Lophium mytilinum]
MPRGANLPAGHALGPASRAGSNLYANSQVSAASSSRQSIYGNQMPRAGTTAASTNASRPNGAWRTTAGPQNIPSNAPGQSTPQWRANASGTGQSQLSTNSRASAFSTSGNISLPGALVPLTYNDVERGDIVCAPHAASLADPNVPVGDPSRTESTIGPLSTKYRYMIVLAKFPQHMIACPLFSHTGRGIGFKPAHIRAEYMALRAHDVKEEDHTNETPHPALEVRYADSSKFRLKDSTNAHVIAPVVINYKSVKAVVGQIGARSIVGITQTFKQLMTRGLEDA